MTQRVPDRSSPSRIRLRLPLKVHQELLGWVLQALTKSGAAVWGAPRQRSFDHGGQNRHALDRTPGYRRNVPAGA